MIKPEPDKFTAFLPLERPPGAATAKADAAVAVATDTLGGQDWDRVGFGWVLVMVAYLYLILICQFSQAVVAFITVATAMAVHAYRCGCR